MAEAVIWLTEDDPDIRELVRYHLERAGYAFACDATLKATRARMARRQPDLLLLDLMLPDGNGLDYCRELRREKATADLPIIMLTARDEDTDVVVGLEVGADDYLTKPFSPRILLARIRAVLRRHQAAEDIGGDDVVVRGPLRIDKEHFTATLDGSPLALTRSEFHLLRLLARRPGIVFSRDRIVDAIHGPDYAVTDRSVDVMVASLRRKLGTHAGLVETVRGVGYRFRADTENA
ncbi:MAG: response regulator [Kiritimatiellia bacterium]|jgi:two-component system alkaline phosphatase synthesis response regulator PhoP